MIEIARYRLSVSACYPPASYVIRKNTNGSLVEINNSLTKILCEIKVLTVLRKMSIGAQMHHCETVDGYKSPALEQLTPKKKDSG